MICKECGSDVSSSEVFCPNCGAPLRVTADYDYIQAEIGGKVDQVLNNDTEGFSLSDAAGGAEKEPSLSIIGNKKAERENAEKERAKEEIANTLSVTRTLYVKDSIFADDEAPDIDETPPEPVTPSAKSRQEYQKSRAERKRRAAERAKKKKRTIILVVVIALVVIGAVVGIILATSGKKEEPVTPVEDVITSNVENGGTYVTPLEVTLWSEQDSRMVYTLDGTDPGVTTGTKYGQPFVLSNDDVGGDSREVLLTVFAYKKDASIKVGELRLSFTLTKSQPAPPYISAESGDYYEPVYISLAAEEGTTIYYTYDGSTPTTNSTKYTGEIEMKRGNNILSAIAVDASGVSSDVASAVYNLFISPNISYDEALANVMSTLISQGLIEGSTPDASGYYPVAGGGKRRVINGGEAVVENTNYYVIQVDYMNDGSSVQATTYYGVNDQTGNVVKLNRSGMSFVLG